MIALLEKAMYPKLSIIEIIGLAVKNEDDAALFYTDFAQLIDNELVKAKFTSLAEEEKKHGKMLADFYMKLTKETTPPPKVPDAARSADESRVEFTVDSIEDLLNLAIKKEREASEFYRKAAEKSENNSGRRMLEYLARIELLHEAALKEELNAFLQDKQWYTEDVDIQLVGP